MKDINKLRYADDNEQEHKGLFEKGVNNSTSHRMHLLSTSLKVTPEITPEIYTVIQNVILHIGIDNIILECYVYSDSEMNASCFSIGDDINIIIMLSSGLVNKMKHDELAFVIGHEIGHYLFGHLEYMEADIEKNDLINMRISKVYQAHEISADRIGLICAGSIESSLRAIVKTVSGLKDDLISNNLHGYLHQIQSLKFESYRGDKYTHPIFPIRAKALTLFSMSELYYWWKDEKKKAPFTTDILTSRIRQDLESTTLNSYKQENDNIVEKFKLWFFVKSFTEDNHLDKEEIQYLTDIFGEELSNKAIKFVQNNPAAISKKYEEYHHKIVYLSKEKKVALLDEMKKSIGVVFPEHDIHKYFKSFKKNVVSNFQ